MTFKYDETNIDLTPRVVAALIELMTAKCEMMIKQDSGYADCWVWGRCLVGDLSEQAAFTFIYGGVEDQPDDDLGEFAVLGITREAVH